MSEPDPLTVDLDTLPLQPQRWMYVLSLILRRHNWQHASRAKGVSHRTNEARAGGQLDAKALFTLVMVDGSPWQTARQSQATASAGSATLRESSCDHFAS